MAEGHTSKETVSQLVEEHFACSGELQELPGYCDQNFLLTTENGEKFIVKIGGHSESAQEIREQNAVLAILSAQGFPVPRAIENLDGNDITYVADSQNNSLQLRLLTYLPGTFYAEVPAARQTPALWRSLGSLLGRLDTALLGFRQGESGHYRLWDLAHGYATCQNRKHVLTDEQVATVDFFLEYYRKHVLPLTGKLPRSVIHNDANDHNLLVDDAKRAGKIIGLIDFGDMVYSHTVNELAIAAAYALMEQEDPVEVLQQLVASYHRERPLSGTEIDALFGLIALRLCTSVCVAATEMQARPDNEYLAVSVRPAWELLGKLRDLSAFALGCQLRRICDLPADSGRPDEDIIEFRRKHLGKTLSLSFEEPLKIVRGEGAYLFDAQGNAYLDMVNNVCHVGHCHPRVVAAGQAQMARLNTNTRFLHDNLVDYAEQLLATMPESLSVVMFVNSGSEANELALRLARNFSGAKDLIVVDGAYHGNTSACIEASPYKFNGPGGKGAADHVHPALLPDPYRGEFRGAGSDVAAAYADSVGQLIEKLAGQGRKPGAYLCESLQGVAGQIIMPDGYLQAVYPMVRDAGGVCIADEVQVGFGRVGSHMWAFETQAVVPDILTLGKPIGNGHPMAAVVTTQEIADAFVTGMEYFNTFGGNPVSCAIGMAVLDVIRDEGLQQNALETGEYLRYRLVELQAEFALIGDVRGLGLFIGVELVSDRTTREPASRQAAELVELLKARRIILSTEGRFHNVLKIKPPIVFSRADADRFVTELSTALGAVRPVRA